MSEYSREPLYFVKMPKGFFDQHWVKILEGTKDGDRFLLFYLKLVCESIGHGGYLRYSEEKPYDGAMIASITNVTEQFAVKAMDKLKALGLLEVTENGTLLLPKVGEMVLKTTKGADTKATKRQKKEDKRRTNGGQNEDNSSPDNRYKIIDTREKDNKERDKESEEDVSDEQVDEAIESILGERDKKDV